MPATQSSPKRLDIRLLAGLLGLTLMNSLSLNTIPLINGVWTERLHYDPTRVGFLLTLHLVTTAGVSITLSNRLNRIEPRGWGLIAGSVLIATNLWFAVQDGYWALLGGSVISGAALGVLIACCTAALASTIRVDRNSAMVSIAATFLVATFTVPIAHLMDAVGAVGLFLAQAAVATFAVCLTSLLPARKVEEIRPQPMSFILTIGSPFVLSAVCLELGTAGIWAFTERIGAGIGLAPAIVGDVIAGASMFGIAGAIASAYLARPGRELLLAVCLLYTSDAVPDGDERSGVLLRIFRAICNGRWYFY